MSNVATLNKRYELVAWGILLIWIGAVFIIPGVPHGAGWIGAGIVLLGLNLARYLHKIPTIRFSIIAGEIALVIGIARLLRATWPIFVYLIVAGVVAVLRGITRKERVTQAESTVGAPFGAEEKK